MKFSSSLKIGFAEKQLIKWFAILLFWFIFTGWISPMMSRENSTVLMLFDAIFWFLSIVITLKAAQWSYEDYKTQKSKTPKKEHQQ